MKSKVKTKEEKEREKLLKLIQKACDLVPKIVRDQRRWGLEEIRIREEVFGDFVRQLKRDAKKRERKKLEKLK